MLPSETSPKSARRARTLILGRRWVPGRQQGALGSLVVALAAAGVGLVVGAVIGTESGSSSERQMLPPESGLAAGSLAGADALLPAQVTLEAARALDGPAEQVASSELLSPPASNHAVDMVGEPGPLLEDGVIHAMIPDDQAEVAYDYPITDESLAIVVPDAEVEPDPLWQRHSVSVAGLGGRPVIALVIDDLGLNRVNSRRAIALPAPLTLSFLTYAEGLDGLTRQARDAGHELLVHVPMEPRDLRWDPGPNALLVGLPEDELERRLEWALGRFDGYVGINNHMGSRFTTSLLGMAQVMAALKSRGLLFLDSLTAGSSVGVNLARRLGVPHAGRDIFIDNTPEDERSIWSQLRKLERVARRRGEAIGIAHPHDKTLDVLRQWIPEASRRGFVLVPLTTVVERAMAASTETSGPE